MTYNDILPLTLRSLLQEFPDIRVEKQTEYYKKTRIWVEDLWFPTSPDSDYDLSLEWWFTSDNRGLDLWLSAHLKPDRFPRSVDRAFWYEQFEEGVYESVEEFYQDFREGLFCVFTHETRIIQRKGWMLWEWIMEYKEGEKWESYKDMGRLRWNDSMRANPIKGHEMVYYAQPLCPILAGV